MKKLIPAIVIATALVGCASPYKEFYRDETGGIDLKSSPIAIMPTAEPVVYRGTHPNVIEKRLLEENHILLGRSSFSAGSVPEEDAIAQAKAVHASAVALYSEYSNTVSGSMPLITPSSTTSNTYVSGYSGNTPFYGNAATTTRGTQTTYIPFSVDRHHYYASYWIKRKPPVFGAIIDALTPQLRKEIGSNRGVMVVVVIKGSAADKADVLEDDVIKKIGQVEINGPEDYSNALQKSAGQSVDVLLVRGGKNIIKTIQLNQRM